MLFTSLLQHYFLWHYTQALREIFHVAKNIRWFTIHFFSLPALVRSLFSPWKRMTEERERGFSFEDLAGVIIINLLSRLIGFTLRLTIIVTGLFALCAVLILTAVTYFVWFIAPIAIILGVVGGLAIIFM